MSSQTEKVNYPDNPKRSKNAVNLPNLYPYMKCVIPLKQTLPENHRGARNAILSILQHTEGRNTTLNVRAFCL